MRGAVLTLLGVTTLLALSSLTRGDEPKSASGPKIDAQVPGSFRPFNVTGKYKDKFHSPITEYGLNPVIGVFVRGSDVSDDFGKKFLKKLDGYIDKYDRSSLRGFVVFLNDDVLDDEQRASPSTKQADVFKDDDLRATLAEKLRAASTALELKDLPFSVYSAAGPKGYNLKEDVTVVLYYNHEVKKVFAFQMDDLKEDAVKKVLDAIVDKLVTRKK